MLHARLRAAAGNRGGIPTDGLVIRYTMDDISGSTLFDSQGNYDATLRGDPVQTAGVIGQAISFDGSGDWAGTSSALSSVGDFTACMWLKINNTGKENYIFSLDYNSSNSIILFHNNGSYQMLIFDGGSNAGIKNISSSTPSSFTHIILRRSGTNINFRVNNSLTYNVSNSSFDPLISGNLELGWAEIRNNTGTYLDGEIDQFLFYDRALTTEEMAEVYEEGA